SKLLAREGGRSSRERLRRPRLLAGHVALGDRALLDGPQRLAGHPVEDPHEALLAELRDRGDRLAAVPDGQQLPRGGIVVIPDIVVDHLEVPEAFAGPGIEGQQAIAKEIRAFAVDSVEVVLGTGGRRVDDAALLIDGELAPHIGAADALPRIFRPRVVAELAG